VLGSTEPIWSTRLPSFEKAAERFEEVVDLTMPPLPYTAITRDRLDVHRRCSWLNLRAAFRHR